MTAPQPIPPRHRDEDTAELPREGGSVGPVGGQALQAFAARTQPAAAHGPAGVPVSPRPMSRAKCAPVLRRARARAAAVPAFAPADRLNRSNRSRTSVRRAWSLEEDDAIRKLVADHGTKSWSRIAEALRTDFGIEERTGKQCRERWHNHLGPPRARTAPGPAPSPRTVCASPSAGGPRRRRPQHQQGALERGGGADHDRRPPRAGEPLVRDR